MDDKEVSLYPFGAGERQGEEHSRKTNAVHRRRGKAFE